MAPRVVRPRRSPRGWRPIATATDTGGSIRQPASLCGVTGIKPTYGRVSRYGMIAFASSLDQGGLISQSAEDAALVLGAMSGFDPRDSTSVDTPVPDYVATLDAPLAGLKIGLIKEFFDKGLDADVEKLHPRGAQGLREARREAGRGQTTGLPLSVPTYYVVAPAECSSNLARFDGVRYGYRCKDPKDLMDLYKRSRGEGFGAEVKRRIMTGTYVLSAGYYDAYYLKAQRVRQLINQDFKRAFGEVDVLIGPTAPDVAFAIGAKTSDPIQMYLNDIYTIGANLAGVPAMSIPCGFVRDLPVGLQIAGRTSRRRSCSTWRMPTRRRPTGIAGCRPRSSGEAVVSSANGWETVIGLEIHAQLSTKSKIFSGSPTAYGVRAQLPGQSRRPRRIRACCRCSTAKRCAWP